MRQNEFVKSNSKWSIDVLFTDINFQKDRIESGGVLYNQKYLVNCQFEMNPTSISLFLLLAYNINIVPMIACMDIDIKQNFMITEFAQMLHLFYLFILFYLYFELENIF